MIGYSFTKHADRQLRKFPIEIQKRIIKKIIHYISTGSPLHFADTVEAEQGKVYRFRIGDYRVIFDWQDGHILVTRVSIRSGAY